MSKVPEIAETEPGCVESHFLDSGSFSLWSKAAKYKEANPTAGEWDYYDTEDFWQYVDDYAAFVKKNSAAIDLYANVDVIPNPKLTWRDQKYLEREHELRPVPVVHYRTNVLDGQSERNWLQHYIDQGHEIIALGGLVGSTAQDECHKWLDQCFNHVCNNPKRLPCVKLHGFGVTSYSLMLRYPWWSVDSASWTKVGAFGGLLVPKRRGGKYVYNVEPYIMKVSPESPQAAKKGQHFETLTPAEQTEVRDWLVEINVPLGKKVGDEIVEEGVVTHHSYRKAANLYFFERMRLSIPEWPWAFRTTRSKGFGIT